MFVLSAKGQPKNGAPKAKNISAQAKQPTQIRNGYTCVTRIALASHTLKKARKKTEKTQITCVAKMESCQSQRDQHSNGKTPKEPHNKTKQNQANTHRIKPVHLQNFSPRGSGFKKLTN